MYAFLLSVGIVAALAGLAALGFGIPNNGFDVGNTLIIAGTTGLSAGLVLIGLAGCLRELRRLADLSSARTPGRAVRNVEPAEAPPRGAPSPRPPFAPKIASQPMPDERDPFAPEPRVATSDAAEEPVERPRPNIFAIGRAAAEQPMMPQEPEPMPRPAARMGRGPAPEAPYEPKFGPADILARLGQQRAGARPEPGRQSPVERPGERQSEWSAARQGERPSPEPEPPNMFESMWPTGGQAARPAGPDTIARMPRPEPRSEQRPEAKAEPKVEMREPDEHAIDEDPHDVMPPARPPEARTVSILKSGVIDGMAYTLYTDGSIEAQLPQGTMRFASIEELRTHLERHG
jgi:hypothetical protein